MSTVDDIVRRYRIDKIELTAWVEQRWVRPRQTSEGPVFDEIDEARVGLIRELRQDLMIDDEALGLVLSLLDQLYAARQMLRSVEEAVAQLPQPLRDALHSKLRGPTEG